ncbi:hypothetical protein [Microbacterium sp.]|uniref:hypothetical protein n=1 Tax=Microbacterium sp. TaxID=51671 RepID=UPI003A9228C5
MTSVIAPDLREEGRFAERDSASCLSRIGGLRVANQRVACRESAGCGYKTWSDEDFELYHFRYRDGLEVDVVMEFSDGSVAAVEIKSGTTLKAEHFKALTVLRDKLGDRFIGGIVLSATTRGAVFGDRLMALPISSLWEL